VSPTCVNTLWSSDVWICTLCPSRKHAIGNCVRKILESDREYTIPCKRPNCIKAGARFNSLGDYVEHMVKVHKIVVSH
jgi:hypothetical protein